MKKIIILLLFINITVFSQTLNEMRAVWITNVDSDVLMTDVKIAEAMDYLESIGINVIFPVVWNKGYTIYPSQIMNSEFGLPIWPSVAGRDPLKRVVVEAHRNGIEVIPWFEFGFSPSYSLNGGHILAKYPDWGLKNNTGNLVVKNGFDWMSGIVPGVQNFMTSLVMEVIDNYDVDGVQGDDRLPAMPVEGGYEEYTKNLYKSENNGNNPPSNYADNNWMKWRADKLNAYYKSLRDSVKAKGEYLIFSSGPSVYPWGYQNYLQDTKTWVTDGIIDNFIPQLYRQDLSAYNNELTIALSYVPANKKDIFFAGILAKAGSYVISPALMLSSLNSNRQKGVKGETFFFYEALRKNNNLLGDTLKATYYKEKAIPPFRNGNIWRPKAVIVNEDETNTIKTGNWTTFGISGFKPNILMTNDPNYASVEYFMDVPFDAYFDVFAYVVTNSVNATNVLHTVYFEGDSSKIYVDQKDSKNKGWYNLGSFYLKKGNKKVLKIDNSGIDAGKYVIADASMIMINRKLSPNVVITDVKEDNTFNNMPIDFQLSQNYPNPFNPTTVIEYKLKEQTNVALSIYNVLGQKITTLVNQEQSAGSYKVNFNSEDYNLSSGIYFYTLKVNNFTSTKKMVYLR
ncbi:MAG TPA: family 10 glycosylhydrolase [Melioribacteraceae bacterium]|nr:family 10 glycosylhydrolase [Melioribacteraceae bacterium]